MPTLMSPTYNVSQKSSPPPKTFCNILTQAKYIFVKFCQYVASLHLHISTNFGGFILIFSKMALIFLGVPIVFNVFSFKFHQVKQRDFIANNEWSSIYPTSVHWLGGNAGVLGLLQAATSSQVYKCTFADLVCLAGESSIDNAVKENCN